MLVLGGTVGELRKRKWKIPRCKPPHGPLPRYKKFRRIK